MCGREKVYKGGYNDIFHFHFHKVWPLIGCLVGRMDGCMDGRRKGWMYGCMVGWMEKGRNGWMDL